MDNNFNPNNGYPGPVPGKGKSIASLVLGIVSCVICWFGFSAIVSIILSIIGIVLSVGAKKEMQLSGDFSSRGMATAGLVLSIVSLALSAIVFVACTILVAAIGTTARAFWW